MNDMRERMKILQVKKALEQPTEKEQSTNLVPCNACIGSRFMASTCGNCGGTGFVDSVTRKATEPAKAAAPKKKRKSQGNRHDRQQRHFRLPDGTSITCLFLDSSPGKEKWRVEVVIPNDGPIKLWYGEGSGLHRTIMETSQRAAEDLGIIPKPQEGKPCQT